LKSYVDEALQAAVKLWDDAIEAKFVERKGKGPDIQISFSTFYHGDEFPFDGMGNEIAHAGPNGRNLKWVLAHEIGHSLGLPHTLEQSIMMPYYGGYEAAEPHLSAYDIDVIQKLYGKLHLLVTGCFGQEV
uniref:ZnMc domain-containing protein n=1 Tax=Anisakis simplex TaxID=6269 RepID=A0A0M3K9U5_ANISI